MRLTLLLLVISVFSAFSSSYAQKTKLDINVQNSSVKDVLYAIETQSEFFFMYNNKQVDVERKVDLMAESSTVDVVLGKLFAGTEINFRVVNRQILLFPNDMINFAEQQERKVSGKVTDSSGALLPGASVVVKGTTTGVITDNNGNYSLSNIPENSTLQFSFVGMKSRDILLKNETTINIVLEEETIGMKDVVVIGYGTQNKAMVSTAISSMNSEKLISIPVTNPTLAMVGQIAGVRFQQAGGDPGSAPYIRIRGSGSLTSSNSPLFVIDGYPTNDASLFNVILPNDIESIDILKDAASAAIYGSRAGNGVILVTTKSGKSGKTKFTFDNTTGFEQVSKKYDMASPELYVEVAKEARTYQGLAIPAILNDPSRWVRTDWQDVIFRTAPFQNTQIGASGGTEKINFNISVGYLDNEGVILNSFDKRYSMRASFNAKLNDKLKVGVNIAPTYSVTRSQTTSGGNTSAGIDGILADAVSCLPIVPAWKENGDYFIRFQDAEIKTFSTGPNALNKLDANLNYTYSFRQTANAFVSYEPIKRLIFKSTFSTGIINSRNEVYREAFLAKGNGDTGNISTPNLAQITASRSNGTSINWYWSNTASYDFMVNENHLFTALMGYDVSKQDNYSVVVTPRTDVDNPIAFINTSIKNISGATLTTGATAKDEYVFDAIFARVNYAFDRKYLLSCSIRRDRSSRFGPDNRTGVFPSVSAGWNITEEPFMEKINFLTLAKIRLSYGETGNDRLSGSYPWVATLNKNYYNFGVTDARVLTYAPSGFSNAGLGWEKNKQYDAGVDFGFLQDRINLTLDIYERNSNTIMSASVPILNGKAATAMQNIGNVRNRGLEITFNSKNFTGPFKWQTDFNISFNRNKITALNGDSKMFINGTSGTLMNYIRNYLARPMSDIYAYKVVGVFNNALDLTTYPKFGSQGIGDLRFADVSGAAGVPDGKIDANDMTLIGNAQPAFVYGLKNSFQYKNFDLNILLDGSQGGWTVNQFERAISLNRSEENIIARIAKNRWQSETNPGDGQTPRAGTANLSSNITNNSRYIFKTSFLRIRNISFGYNFPSALVQKLGVQNARVFLAATNLYTFTSYPGYNPEGNTNGDNATTDGYDLGSYPLPKNISAGINLSF